MHQGAIGMPLLGGEKALSSPCSFAQSSSSLVCLQFTVSVRAVEQDDRDAVWVSGPLIDMTPGRKWKSAEHRDLESTCL